MLTFAYSVNEVLELWATLLTDATDAQDIGRSAREAALVHEGHCALLALWVAL